jgi:hypothetical protein
MHPPSTHRSPSPGSSLASTLLLLLLAPAGCSSYEDKSNVYGDGSVAATALCKVGSSSGAVQKPVLVRNIRSGETGWFGSPAIVDLDGDGKKEIVAPFYRLFVFDAKGQTLAKGSATKDRIYAPAVVADLDGDKVTEIVVGGNDGTVAAYEYKKGALSVKSGWPASTCSGGQCPEARGMAAADLDGDGKIEVVVTTTNTSSTGAQVFVFSPDGKTFQPKGTGFTAWPRYNTRSGTGGDADFNGAGNHGYGCYGENVGIGNIDDDAQLEILVTFDDHQINAFKLDGTSVLASSYYTNRTTAYSGRRLAWGQFIRWADPKVEEAHYHDHTGSWPSVTSTPWLQWTASPPNVVDLDGDGKNEVVGVPNVEMNDPYETQGWAFMALEGAHGDGSRSARRFAGFETLPTTERPVQHGEYPPGGIPAPATVSLLGDARPEIVVPAGDGYVYAVSPGGERLWRYGYGKGAADTFASEVAVADLNQDGRPEVIFGVYSGSDGGGRLVVLENTGALLFDLALEGQGENGNGVGVPAAPAVGDLDGDGAVEIVLSTFDHGLDVYTVPGSATNCVLWATGRGGLLRSGAGPNTAK